MNIQYYLDYAKNMNCAEDVFVWIKNVISKQNDATQNEIEHIIDYMASVNRPHKIFKMSFEQAKNNTEKWNNSLQKKGRNIVEIEGVDFEVALDFKDGFKVVKLISENSYKKEGFLMRHCVASYYGKDTEIYSLRDDKNQPHCTIEKNQQVKGKGNGEITPKYIKYVVDFLVSTGFTVGENEILNLGYVNIEPIKDLISQDYFLFDNKFIEKKNLFNLKNKENETFFSQDFDLIFDNKIIFDLSKIENYVQNLIGTQNASSGDSTQNSSSGDSTQNASSGYNTKNASSGNYTQNASSGDSTRSYCYGTNSITADIGNGSSAGGVVGTWITLAEYDDDNNIIIVKSAIIDGIILKSDIFYTIKNKEFVEAENQDKLEVQK